MKDYSDESLKFFEERDKTKSINETYEMLKENKQKTQEERYNIITIEQSEKVKTKQMPKEKHTNLVKKTLLIISVALGISAGTTMFVDVANHPEDYMTTHPEFEGAPTISEIIERTPENFGIGGR